MAIKSAIKKVVIKFKLACRLSDKLVVFTQSLCLAMAGAYFFAKKRIKNTHVHL